MTDRQRPLPSLPGLVRPPSAKPRGPGTKKGGIPSRCSAFAGSAAALLALTTMPAAAGCLLGGSLCLAPTLDPSASLGAGLPGVAGSLAGATGGTPAVSATAGTGLPTTGTTVAGDVTAAGQDLLSAKASLGGLPSLGSLRLGGLVDGLAPNLDVLSHNSVVLGRGSTDGGQPNVVSVGTAGAERRVVNVAGGNVAVGSTDAVNGGQLYGIQQQVQAVDHAAVKYDVGADGRTQSAVTLSSDAGGPVAVHNVAGGQSPTDAVNMGQLSSMATSTLSQANGYTDTRIGALAVQTQQEIDKASRDAWAGTAAALAATGLRYDDRPGKTALSGAASYYHDQAGLAFGLGHTTVDGRFRMNAAVTVSPTADRPEVGAVVGGSWSFN